MWMTFYGLDWVATAFTLTGIYLLGNKNKAGFFSMMMANICWGVIGVMAHSYAMIIANIVFFAMNIRGIIRWRKMAKVFAGHPLEPSQ